MLLVNLSVIIFQWVKTHLGKSTFWGLLREFVFVQKRWNSWSIKWKRKGVNNSSSRPGVRPPDVTQIWVGGWKHLTYCLGSQSALVTRSAHARSFFQALQNSPSSFFRVNAEKWKHHVMMLGSLLLSFEIKQDSSLSRADSFTRKQFVSMVFILNSSSYTSFLVWRRSFAAHFSLGLVNSPPIDVYILIFSAVE